MGVFNAVRPRAEPAFPHRHPEFSVFLQLTDAEGDATGRITARKADSDRLVFASQAQPIQFVDRLQVKWVRFRLRDCPFPEPGLYWIQFYCAGELLASNGYIS